MYYGKCPNISFTKVSDKIAYTEQSDHDEIDQGLHCLPIYKVFLETTS